MVELVVGLREERIFWVTLTHEDVVMKIEMINDVPSLAGVVQDHPFLGRLDTPEKNWPI